MPASEKDPAGFNAIELSSYCRERGLFAEQVDRWRETAQDANAVLTMRSSGI